MYLCLIQVQLKYYFFWYVLSIDKMRSKTQLLESTVLECNMKLMFLIHFLSITSQKM